MAALLEAVEADEKGVVRDLPLATDLALVLVIGDLKVGTRVKSGLQLVVGFTWLLVFDEGKDLVAVDRVAALVDDRVRNLSDQHDKAGRRVVVLRVGPDQQDGVHDGHEKLVDVSQLLALIRQLNK